MNNPAFVVPDVMPAMYALSAALKKGGIPEPLLYLVTLRASQINGCSFCVDMHAQELLVAGETPARIFTLSA
jgi:AhpD family alkylhydroperoxidase